MIALESHRYVASLRVHFLQMCTLWSGEVKNGGFGQEYRDRGRHGLTLDNENILDIKVHETRDAPSRESFKQRVTDCKGTATY